MKYFVRPSRSELMIKSDELETVINFEEILEERSQMLSREISHLKELRAEILSSVFAEKQNLLNESKVALDVFGILGLQRIGFMCKDSVSLQLNSGYILITR